ncbi:MAG: response regulator [Candidatus Omnitrophica bacterium]|nr:response regulator [Candidatus Omnitrophota bacterium]
MKILIIDDSQLERTLLVKSLQKAGIKNEILEATDGQAALDILESEYEDICLIFLDWQLPKIDGLEVLKRIAQNPKTASLPVIMSTSANSPEDEEIARLLNPNLAAFTIKPLDPEKIVEIALSHLK